MNHLKIAQGIAGATALATMLAFAAPVMAQSATTYPPGTDCSKFTGAAMAQCQSQVGQPKNSSNLTGAPAIPNGTNNGTVNGGINGSGTTNGVNGTGGAAGTSSGSGTSGGSGGGTSSN